MRSGSPSSKSASDDASKLKFFDWYKEKITAAVIKKSDNFENFSLNEKWSKLSKKIKDINFPRSAIIGGVIRDDKGLIALGDFKIKEGDKVLICSLYEGIGKVEKLFL